MGSAEITQAFISGLLQMSAHILVPLILFMVGVALLLRSYFKGRKNISAKNAILHRCPKCGSVLVVRTAKKGAKAGEQFYGCGKYPSCKFTSEI